MYRLISALILLFAPVAMAHIDSELGALTDDGRRVVLRPDHTWEFVERQVEGDPGKSAVLSVVGMREMRDACGLDLRLQNNLGYKIRSLVPRFAVYNTEGVLFDDASKPFASIKPTKDQYTSIQFSGIGCHEISHIRVHDAGRCRMGNIDQWNEEEGECLSHIYVEPTDLISISK